MKKVIISVLVSAFIMLLVPLLIVEVLKPDKNAESTQPNTPTPSAEESQVYKNTDTFVSETIKMSQIYKKVCL